MLIFCLRTYCMVSQSWEQAMRRFREVCNVFLRDLHPLVLFVAFRNANIRRLCAPENQQKADFWMGKAPIKS